ncbi:hypothetical protein OG563_07235 [Nocardia vinacea]|uniref:Uncharacterized protein n=1 Tax=Nocardia vinacea TaxID=96468 RepID=A0ABZ1Z0R3_9NOCA|nr:hypothetical protein [Nocardia vinacea]
MSGFKKRHSPIPPKWIAEQMPDGIRVELMIHRKCTPGEGDTEECCGLLKQLLAVYSEAGYNAFRAMNNKTTLPSVQKEAAAKRGVSEAEIIRRGIHLAAMSTRVWADDIEFPIFDEVDDPVVDEVTRAVVEGTRYR